MGRQFKQTLKFFAILIFNGLTISLSTVYFTMWVLPNFPSGPTKMSLYEIDRSNNSGFCSSSQFLMIFQIKTVDFQVVRGKLCIKKHFLTQLCQLVLLMPLLSFSLSKTFTIEKWLFPGSTKVLATRIPFFSKNA